MNGASSGSYVSERELLCCLLRRALQVGLEIYYCPQKKEVLFTINIAPNTPFIHQYVLINKCVSFPPPPARAPDRK